MRPSASVDLGLPMTMLMIPMKMIDFWLVTAGVRRCDGKHGVAMIGSQPSESIGFVEMREKIVVSERVSISERIKSEDSRGNTAT